MSECPILGPKYVICACTGRRSQEHFPGLKVEWPELQGVSALLAKATIERDNPKVTAFIYPTGVFLPSINCLNRVVLYISHDDCPNGPVLNRPFVG